jgi:hypothetical protein
VRTKFKKIGLLVRVILIPAIKTIQTSDTLKEFGRRKRIPLVEIINHLSLYRMSEM